MNQSFAAKHSFIKDVLGIALFVALVAGGTVFINAFVFRSFNVLGPSMEPTLYTGDRLIVNRLPMTLAQLRNRDYQPERGQVIVFENPQFVPGAPDEYIVKRVVAFPGEKVVVRNGTLTVFNQAHPRGFQPDPTFNDPIPKPTTGSVNTVVPRGSLFVAGDHRNGDFSYDSRNGLGFIPYYDVVGPVVARIWPVTDMRAF